LNNYLLGIDNGSTVTKASIFDFDGVEVASYGCKSDLLTPKAGYYERDMNQIWEANVEAVSNVIKKASIDSKDIKAVSLTGHGNGLHLVDEKGEPVRNSIEGLDSRASGYVKKLMDDGTFEKTHPLTMQILWPALSSLIFLWMIDNEPESLKKAEWSFTVVDYVRFKLTGVANTEITNLSGVGLLNTKEEKLDSELLDLMGLSEIERLIPPLVKSTDICGEITKDVAKITGLEEGTPVVAGLYDIDAAAVSTGVIDESKMNVIAGTWCNNQYVSKTPIISDRFFSTTVFSNPGYYLMLEGSPTSASNLEWFVGEFLQAENKIAKQKGTSVFDICNEAVKKTNPEDTDIVFVPFLYGSNAKPNAKSVILGLQGWHKREHVIRAIYEGICFSHKWHVDKLMEYREKPNAARFAGGASRSDVWLQMFADVLQMPMEITRAEELGTLGAAICGAVGIGVFESFDSASKKMVHVDRRFDPQKDKEEIYNRKFKRYKKAIKSLEDYWE
jgi:L-xylulokinase